MRILAFYPYVPFPLDRGAHYRGFYLLRELARAHEVDLLALCEKGAGLDYRHVFQEFCRRVELVPFQHPPWQRFLRGRLMNPLPTTVAHWTVSAATDALRRLSDAERYDAIHVLDAILVQHVICSRVRVPFAVDRTRVDLQYQLMEHRHMRSASQQRLLNLENTVKLWLYERKVARRARLEVVCGPDDATFLHRYVSPRLETLIVPNGVDLDFFHPEAAPGHARAIHPTLLFCGAMDYNPNIDALRWYFAEMHDSLRAAVPDLRLLIVGKDPVPEVRAYGSRPGVRVTGAVPDVRPYYRQAWLQMVPLRIGGGTRLKIVESMAMSTPVVSTSIGGQGLRLRHGEDILLADSATSFVKEAARALCDPELLASLGKAGFQTIRSRLSWPMLGRQLAQCYSEKFAARHSVESEASYLTCSPSKSKTTARPLPASRH